MRRGYSLVRSAPNPQQHDRKDDFEASRKKKKASFKPSERLAAEDGGDGEADFAHLTGICCVGVLGKSKVHFKKYRASRHDGDA